MKANMSRWNFWHSLCLVLMPFLLPLPALANDTEADIGIGGLTFSKSKNIEMLSENLYVSREQIVVKYLFRNNSSKDVDTLVAFPLPEFKWSGYVTERSGVSNIEFVTTVDGERVATEVERKAYLFGSDVTATLSKLDVPLNPDDAFQALDAKTSTVTQLTRLGLLDENGSPTWTTKTVYYWHQRFPAGQRVAIEHRYKPAIGGTVATAIGTSRWAEARSLYDKYCVDQSVISAVKGASTHSPESPPFYETWISYVLATGANWASPIRNFRLIVDKGHSDNLVSFCADGVRQITPTEFEFSAKNFVPTHDLNVLILNRHESNSSSDDAAAPGLTSLSCDELWYKRNSYYKAAGYCFKTPRAIAQFGNSGCAFDDIDRVPISNADRTMISQIKALEQSRRCSR